MTARSAPGLDTDVRCPRCGAALAGDAWCPQCGLNLRPRAAAAGVPPGDSVPPRPEPTGPRRPTPAIAAGLAVIVMAIGVTIAATSGESGTGPAPLPTATATEATPTATTGGSDVTVTADAMAAVLQRYVEAYSAEDLAGLESLFAPEFERANGVDAPEDITAALATYAGQFSQLSNARYSLSGVTYHEGDGVGGAAGSYRITSDSGVSTGTIAFGFRASDDGLLINHIEVEPS